MDATINPARTFSAPPYAEDDALLARKLLAELPLRAGAQAEGFDSLALRI